MPSRVGRANTRGLIYQEKSPGKSFPIDSRLALRLNRGVQCVSIIPLSIHLVPVRLSWPGFYLNPLRGIIVVAKGSMRTARSICVFAPPENGTAIAELGLSTQALGSLGADVPIPQIRGLHAKPSHSDRKPMRRDSDCHYADRRCGEQIRWHVERCVSDKIGTVSARLPRRRPGG
jgi:hypothetical protein